MSGHTLTTAMWTGRAAGVAVAWTAMLVSMMAPVDSSTGFRCGNCTVCDSKGLVQYNISLLGHYQSLSDSYVADFNYVRSFGA